MNVASTVAGAASAAGQSAKDVNYNNMLVCWSCILFSSLIVGSLGLWPGPFSISLASSLDCYLYNVLQCVAYCFL